MMQLLEVHALWLFDSVESDSYIFMERRLENGGPGKLCVCGLRSDQRFRS